MTTFSYRFTALTHLLRKEEALWRQRAFVQPVLPWETARPALSAALRALDPEEILQFENYPTKLPALRRAEPGLIEEIEAVTSWPPLPASADEPLSTTGPKRVSARKWTEIRHLANTVAACSPNGVTRFVDWCAGKGHLARAFHRRFMLPVTCVEHNAPLCETGRNETDISGDAVDFICVDALSEESSAVLDRNTAAVALHACGRLNASLLRFAVRKRVPYLAVVPCCYQNIDGMAYTPLSDEAREQPLPLTRRELRLPALDDRTAAPGTRALRRREHAFRLGMDLLHRQATGVDRYLALGRIPPARLKLDFQYFVQTTAAEKNLSLPRSVNWKAAEIAAWQRFYEASALGLAQGLFRRVLESRLFLDRVLFLEAKGYRVRAGTFCEDDVTFRNLMFIAELP